MYHIGDVQVTDTECTNPYTYKGEYKVGDPRRAALIAFANGTATADMQLWYAPSCGGADRITASEVDWSGLSTSQETASLRDLLDYSSE